MSEDRTPSGGHTDMHSQTSLVLQICDLLFFAVHVWQVGQRRHPVATNCVARHSMSEGRAPSLGVRLCFQTNSQMSPVRRLSYKAFDEAKPPAPSQPAERDYVD